MSKELLKYKDYSGSIEISIEDGFLYGEVLFINDTIMYHANTIPELKTAFEEAVDQYIADCEDIGKQPNKAFSGSFNVRIEPQTHRDLAFYAYKNDISMNLLIKQALNAYLQGAELSRLGKISVDINHKHEHQVTFSYSGEIDSRVTFKQKSSWTPTIVKTAEVA